MSDRDIVLFLRNMINGGEDGTLRRTVAVIEFNSFRRFHGCQFFASDRNGPESRCLHFNGKLTSDLRCHKGHRHAVLDKVFIHGRKIQPHFFGYDTNRSTGGKCRIHIHHAGIESVGCILSGRVIFSKGKEFLIPVDETYQIAVCQFYAFWNTGTSGCIKQDEKVIRHTFGRR